MRSGTRLQDTETTEVSSSSHIYFVLLVFLFFLGKAILVFERDLDFSFTPCHVYWVGQFMPMAKGQHTPFSVPLGCPFPERRDLTRMEFHFQASPQFSELWLGGDAWRNVSAHGAPQGLQCLPGRMTRHLWLSLPPVFRSISHPLLW